MSVHAESSRCGDECQPGQSDRGSEDKSRWNVAAAQAGESHAAQAQAVDRAHRIGQTRSVMVYRMVAKDTIEEKVMALKARKAELFGSVFEADGLGGGELGADDIRDLLAA